MNIVENLKGGARMRFHIGQTKIMGFYIGQTKIFGISILSQNTQSSYEIKRQLGNGVTESTSNILTIKEGGSVDLKFTLSSGYVFDNATATNCQYSWKPSTGTLTISNPTSTFNVSVSSLQRLMKPTNLSISDGTLTFDEVANATNYAIYDNDTTILDTI